MASNQLDVARARSAFPALKDASYIYADNAGGSQCLASVVEKLSDYLLRTNVQLGADYSVSVQSTARVGQGLEAARELFNAASTEEVSFGNSSSMLAENVARAIDADILDGEEIIVTGEHEGTLAYRLLSSIPEETELILSPTANGGPWKKLAKRRGLTVKLWHATQIAEFPNNPYAVALQVDTLLPLITAKTRLIAFTGCSNLLGSVVPVKAVTAAARAKAKELGVRKLEVSIDCVAYAPHRRVDVQDWDVDYCIFSLYKVSFITLPLVYNIFDLRNNVTGVWTTYRYSIHSQAKCPKFPLRLDT